MQSKLAEFQRILADSESKITEYQNKHPEWPKDPEKDFERLKVRSEENQKEMEHIQTQLAIYRNKAKQIVDKEYQGDKYQVYTALKELVEEEVANENEAIKIEEQTKLFEEKEFLDYFDQFIKKKKALERITKLNQELKTPDAVPITKMSALKKVDTPFGKITVNYNLLENLKNSKEWLEEFSKKNNLSISNEGEEQIIFSTPDGKDVIKVNKEEVSIEYSSIDSEKQYMLIQAGVALYLKGIEKGDHLNHIITCEDPSILKIVEDELSARLIEKGIHSAKINGKSLDEIANLRKLSSA